MVSLGVYALRRWLQVLEKDTPGLPSWREAYFAFKQISIIAWGTERLLPTAHSLKHVLQERQGCPPLILRKAGASSLNSCLPLLCQQAAPSRVGMAQHGLRLGLSGP